MTLRPWRLPRAATRAAPLRFALRFLVLALILAVTLIATPILLAVPEIPNPLTPSFIQTSGPNAGLNIGDYRTNVLGDNTYHELTVVIPCTTPGSIYNFDLFDPWSNASGIAIDEVRGTGDTATFTLLDPAGGQIVSQTFPSSATENDAWVTLASYTAGSVAGVSCGEFHLRILTSNDDDNAWRFRLTGNGFDPSLGPDGVLGTGDESAVGLMAISYQHSSFGCDDFFWFVDDGEPSLYMILFDLDNAATVTYTTPGGVNITGTVSGQTVWNDAAPQQQARPTFADMSTFSVPGDLAGDATLNPEPGLWQATICLDINNQYSFEVPDHLVYVDRPDLPIVSIGKTDGVTIVQQGDTLTYTITLTNSGSGPALPIAGPELVDTLPVGLTFQSCTINAPLAGTCTYDAPTRQVRADLVGQPGPPAFPAFLPGAPASPRNTGTVTVVATVDADAGPGEITNTATIDFTDEFGDDYTPIPASDTDQIVAGEELIDLELTKVAAPVTADTGDTITFTVTVSNGGAIEATGVQVTDTDLVGASFTIVGAVVTSQGAFDTATGIWTVGTLAPGASATLTAQAIIVAPTPVVNRAWVSGADQPDIDSDPTNGFGNGEDDEASATVSPIAADLELLKTAALDPDGSPDRVIFNMLLFNRGPNTATNVQVTDAALNGGSATFSEIEVLGTPSHGTFDPATGVWSIPSLAVSEQATITIRARVAGEGTYTNLAEVTASDQLDPDSTPGNGAPEEDDRDSASIQVGGSTPPGPSPTPAPGRIDPVIVKRVDPALAAVGESVTWTIIVTNPGSTPLDGVTVTDTIPAIFEVLGITTTRGTVSQSGNSFTVTVGTLGAGESATITVLTVGTDAALPPDTCNTAYVGGVPSNEVCPTIFPEILPLTGGGPVEPAPILPWIVLGLGLLAGMLLVLAQRRGRNLTL